MKAEYKYKDIQDTMFYLLVQVYDSIKYCKKTFPKMPVYDLFYFLKENIKFIDDPEGIELIQTSQTFFENNYHGISGGGDCDDFVITVTAYCLSYNIPCEIILAGREKYAPVHIYNRVLDENNKICNFDLTEKNFNDKRYYKYTQNLPFIIIN